jgi:hypothetical protein
MHGGRAIVVTYNKNKYMNVLAEVSACLLIPIIDI